MAVEATAVTATTNRAGFWVRTFAYIIDAIGIGIVSSAIAAIVGGGPTSNTSNGLNLLFGLATSDTSGPLRAAVRRSACAC